MPEENRDSLAHAALLEYAEKHLRYIWHWGDGYGGHVIKVLKEAAEAQGFQSKNIHRTAGRKKLSRATVIEVIAEHGNRCFYCNCKLFGKDLQFDHRIPVSQGGSDKPENLVPACWECNSDKSDSVLI